MDFDAILPLLFFFIFFILPGLLKQRKKKKKPDKAKKPTFFSKIGEQINQFLRELEKQQQQQRQERGQTEVDDIWQALADEDFEEQKAAHEDEPDLDEQVITEPAPISEPEPPRIKDVPVPEPSRTPTYGSVRQFGKNPLQNAVVWAEIIGKPVALK